MLNCPEVHYVVDGGVEAARKVEDLLGERWQERRGCRRKEVKSGKIVNVLHYTVIFARLSSVEEEKQEKQEKQEEGHQEGHQERMSLGVSYLQKTIKTLVEKVHLA